MKIPSLRHSNNTGRIKSCLFSFLILILMISFASLSLAEYRSSGTLSKNYSISGRGLFNDEMDDYKTLVTNIGSVNQNQPSLIYDYDSDNVNEIFVASGTKLYIYYKTTDNILYEGEITSNATIEKFSIYNYNNSPYVVISQDVGAPLYDGVTVFKYNGSDWIHTGTAYYSNTLSESGFNCYENDNKCFYVGERIDFIAGATFNLTNPNGFADTLTLRNYASGNNRLCLSSIPDVTAYNKNDDNVYEYYLTEAETSTISGNVFDVTLHEIAVDSDNQITSDTHVIEIEPDFNNGNGCNNYEYLFTAPLLMRVNDDAVYDAVMGISTNGAEFKLYAYETDGSLIDTFPDVFSADGIIISNPIQTNIFKPNHGLDYRDFCVLGYTNDNRSDLLCGSDKTDSFLGLGDSTEFKSNVTNDFTPSAGTGQNIIHSTNHKVQAYTDEYTADIDEILTPFGVYEVIYHDSVFYDDKLREIFNVPYDYGILIDDDLDNIGLKDLIFTTASSLYVIDDKFINSNAFISNIEICPSPVNVIKVNTTMTITATITDENSDTVQAYASVYNNDPNEQNSTWSILVDSGEIINLGEYQMNKSISNGYIKVFARDSEHNQTVSKTIPFTVGTNGAEFGDSCYTYTYEPEVTEADAVGSDGLPNTNTDNTLTRFADDVSFMTGVPIIIFFLLLIIMIDIILASALFRFPHLLMYLIIIVDLITFIVFSLMGLFPIGLTITLYTILLIIGGFYIYSKFFTGSGGSAGGV